MLLKLGHVTSNRSTFANPDTLRSILEIQTCSKHDWFRRQSVGGQTEYMDRRTVSFDFNLRFFHLLEQFGVTNHSRGIPDLAAGLIQACDDPDDGSFCHVGQQGNLVEWLDEKTLNATWERGVFSYHPSCPLVYHLN